MLSETTMVPFTDELAPIFASLNKAWLEKYFFVEPVDEQMLNNPRAYYLDPGGHIFLARHQGEMVGTIALLKCNEPNVFELSKMAVSPAHQGKNIGNEMLQFVLKKAKELGAEKIILFSNTLLPQAIHLYRKFGFTEVPVGETQYQRCNIKMEKRL